MKEAGKAVKKQVEEMLGMSVEEFKEMRDVMSKLSWGSGHPEKASV